MAARRTGVVGCVGGATMAHARYARTRHGRWRLRGDGLHQRMLDREIRRLEQRR